MSRLLASPPTPHAILGPAEFATRAHARRGKRGAGMLTLVLGASMLTLGGLTPAAPALAQLRADTPSVQTPMGRSEPLSSNGSAHFETREFEP